MANDSRATSLNSQAMCSVDQVLQLLAIRTMAAGYPRHLGRVTALLGKVLNQNLGLDHEM